MGGKPNGTPRNRSPTRGVQRVKSKSQKDALQRRSKSREGRGRGRRTSSGSREFKPTRGLSSTHGSRGSSAESPVQRPPGRTSSSRKPPNRTQSSSSGGRKPPNRTQSSDKLRKPPNRSSSSDKLRKPPNRTQSFGLERGRKPPARSRSFGLDKGLGAHPEKLRRARSASPSLRVRNRSASKERIQRTRGRSADPAYRKSRSRSRSTDRFSDEILRKKSYPSQKPEDNGISVRRLGRSFKRIKRIGDQTRQECTWGQLCQYLTAIAIILGASVGLMFATGNGSIVTDVLDRIIDPSELEDPFSGGNAPHWPADGNGLRVTIIDALTPDWQTTFQLATTDWSYGEPNAVQIFVESGTPNKDCEAPDGYVTVCNGNYGDLKWRGVNEVMRNPRGQMLSSTARMNEYYLANMEAGAWQYTMCHELGHTLGLGHTDENFDNADLGNCMDYTDNLNANKHPDRGNYEKLLSIYGPIAQDIPLRQRQLQLRGGDTLGRQDESRIPTAADAPVVRDASSSSDPLPAMSVHHLRRRDPLTNNEAESHLETKDHDSSLQGAVDIAATTTAAIPTVPDHIKDKKKEAVQKLYQRMKDYYNSAHETNDSKMHPVGHTHHDGWKLVHRVRHGEEHEAELGEGYKVRVQFLLVH